MKKLFVAATAIVAAFADFSPELVQKYSIEILADG